MLAGVGLLATGLSQAALVTTSSYDMLNGEVFHDTAYNGSGNVNADHSYLTGGTGELTDGILATSNYPTETDSYVGWHNETVVIDFHFSGIHDFNTLAIHFGVGGVGGVNAPSQVDINGSTHIVPASENVGSPHFIFFDVTGLAATNLLTVTITPSVQWIFVSEVEFYEADASVPAPSSLWLLLGSLAFMSRCKSKT